MLTTPLLFSPLMLRCPKVQFCEATVGADVSRLLWEGGDRKAANVKLEGAARCAGFPSDEDVADPWQTEGDKDRLQKSIPFVIDVLLVGIPCQSVFDEARRYRLRWGPAINVKTSPHFDVLDPSFCTWVHSVLRAGNIRSLILIPPRSVSRGGKGFDGGLHSRAAAQAETFVKAPLVP